jgi:ABC-type uncharacterized transport system auxiliary subunit
MRRARAGAGLAAIAGLALAGCAAAPAPPADRFWRLSPGVAEAPALPAPLLDGRLGVERPRADGLVGERALVWSEAERPRELHAHAFHHWVEPPGDLLQERLAETLRARGVAREVVSPEMRVQPDWLVSGRLLRFERLLGGPSPGVVVEIRLTLKHVADGQVRWSETYREQTPAEGDGVAEAVAAFDRAVDAAFARFVADLARPSVASGEAGGRL